MKNIICAGLVALFAATSAFAQSTASKPAPAESLSKYFPIERVAPGMKGYGLTVFEGDTIERFDVEILGVINGIPGPKQNLIIAKLSGDKVRETRVFNGMSGSPVYLDGKMVGAVAYAFAFSTEPIAGITPIGQMVSQLKDAPAPSAQAGSSAFSFKDLVAARGVSAADPGALLAALPSQRSYTVAPANPAMAGLAGQTLRPIATPLTFNGIPQEVIDRFVPEFERAGLQAVAGFGGSASIEPLQPFTEDTLKPGSSVVVSLVRGDFNASAAGTVTERDGDRIYAFGHPFLSLGATGMPMAESSVVTVLKSLSNSFKFTTPTRLVGAIEQDRSSGIGGHLGQSAKMIPVRVAFRNSHGDESVFNYEVINDAFLSPLLVNMTLSATVMGTERQIGDQTIGVRGTISVAKQPDIQIENRFAASSNTSIAAAMSVAQPLQLVMGSGFRDVDVTGISVDITATEERSLGQLTRVWVDQTRVGRGDAIEVHAFARTEDGDEYIERIPITIPRDAPIGKVAIIVGDGASMVATDETFAGFAPKNLSQLVEAINKLKKNDRLYVKVIRATGGAVVENQAMPSLPPSVLSSLGSPRASTGFTPLQTSTLYERELAPAKFIVTGQQALILNVVR